MMTQRSPLIRSMLGMLAASALLAGLGACGGGASTGGSTASQSHGIVYKPASQERNEKARGYLTALMKDASAAYSATQGQRFMCGPSLWSQLRKDPKAAGIGGAPAIMMIPSGGQVMKMEGRLLQSDEDLLNFWEALFSQVEFSTVSIRKLSENEKDIYWTMIAWDIEEPVFVVEGSMHNLIVDLSVDESGALEVFWIDDISGYTVK